MEPLLYYAGIARPQLHSTDTMLDTARGLLLEGGSRHATVEAIAQASGAPTGTLYHRFGSRDELIARLWIRAVHRSQASALVAVETSDPKAAALATGLSIIDFCEQEPADAQLLVAFRREDLIAAELGGQIADDLEALNVPIERALRDLARRLYGRVSRRSLHRTALAVFDIPYGAARRYLIANAPLPNGLREDVARAIAAVIDQP